MRTGAIITAAGMSSRMGDFKPMMKVGEETMIRRLIKTFRAAGCDPVTVITGNRADELEAHIADLGVDTVKNENFADSQMLDSVKLGLAHVMTLCDQTFFAPVDVPLFSLATMDRLLHSGAKLAAPVCDGKDGHPLLISAEVIPALLAYDGEGGMKGAMAASGFTKTLVEVTDKGAIYDTDTAADFKRLLATYDEKLLRPLVSVRLAKDTVFFVPELATLLRMIDIEGSVKDAREKMGLSYITARSMLIKAEKQLGFALAEETGSGALALTQETHRLLCQYDELERRLREEGEKLFTEIFVDHR